MKNIRNQMKRGIGLLLIIPVMILFELSLLSCSTEEIEIQKNFPFEVSVMPIPKDIANGETIEIRLKIIPKGNFYETKYYLRYFQFDGSGTLQHSNDSPYLPNDAYELVQKEFRLYYTSTSNVSQNFNVWIFDSFSNEKLLIIQLNHKD